MRAEREGGSAKTTQGSSDRREVCAEVRVCTEALSSNNFGKFRNQEADELRGTAHRAEVGQAPTPGSVRAHGSRGTSLNTGSCMHRTGAQRPGGGLGEAGGGLGEAGEVETSWWEAPDLLLSPPHPLAPSPFPPRWPQLHKELGRRRPLAAARPHPHRALLKL